ncbi:MAG TPA: hypothetical protein VF916_01870 [Ktedonobacterales bacterium]
MIAGASQLDTHQLTTMGLLGIEKSVHRLVSLLDLREGLVGALAEHRPLPALLCVALGGQLPGNTTADILPQDASADLVRAGIVGSAARGEFPTHVLLPFFAMRHSQPCEVTAHLFDPPPAQRRVRAAVDVDGQSLATCIAVVPMAALLATDQPPVSCEVAL